MTTNGSLTRAEGSSTSLDARLYLAWLVATAATLGSLYFSEVRGFIPCTLCWYQRICMYPLALLLGIAAYRRDPAVRPYALGLAASGWLIALYHVLLEWFPDLVPLRTCASSIPCDVRWVNYLGFVTIPVMSFTAFTVIGALLAFRWRR